MRLQNERMQKRRHTVQYILKYVLYEENWLNLGEKGDCDFHLLPMVLAQC